MYSVSIANLNFCFKIGCLAIFKLNVEIGFDSEFKQ